MIRLLLVLVAVAMVVRAVWRLVVGIADGAATGSRRTSSSASSARGVPMVRDPVCGTFVVQSRALTARIGDRVEYFCSEECLNKGGTKNDERRRVRNGT